MKLYSLDIREAIAFLILGLVLGAAVPLGAALGLHFQGPIVMQHDDRPEVTVAPAVETLRDRTDDAQCSLSIVHAEDIMDHDMGPDGEYELIKAVTDMIKVCR